MALAAGGWSLFAQNPSEAEQLTLAGRQNSVMMPSLRTVTAAPDAAERAAERRTPRGAAPGARRSGHPEFSVDVPHPEIGAPRVPTVVVPGPAAPAAPGPEVPELLPKTTDGLRAADGLRELADSAGALTSELEAAGKRAAAAPAELNWEAVARCASRNDPKAVTPDGAYGLYHFTLEDWRSVGGTGLPTEATPEEQTKRAKLLYDRENGRWQELWPQCGKLLFLK